MKALLALSLLLAATHAPAFAAGDPKVGLQTLKDRMKKYGEPKLDGTAEVAGTKLPALYFGKTKINNNFDAVDEVKKRVQGTATIFVKDGDEFVRVSTNVLKEDGSRALGTHLARNKAYETVSKGELFCGEVEILGSPYDTCYEPFKGSDGKVLGLYYFGYKK